MTLDWAPDGTGGFVVTAITGCAKAEVYGSGCVAEFTSFYEWFTTTPSMDLSSSALQMVFTGSTYVVSSNTTAFVAPTAAAANLNLSDDSETTIALAVAASTPS